jgi:uncharacterized coiled-coil protein SlyX
VLNGDKIVINKVENKETMAEPRKANKTPVTTPTTTSSGKSYLEMLSKMAEPKAPKEKTPTPKFTINVKNRWADLKEVEDTAFDECCDDGDGDFFWEAPDAEMREERQLIKEAEQALFPGTQKKVDNAAKKFSMSSDSEEDPEIAELTALIAMTESKTRGLEQSIKDISEKNEAIEKRVAAQTQALHALSAQLSAQAQQQEKLAGQQDTMMTLLQAMQGTLNQLANAEAKPAKLAKGDDGEMVRKDRDL